MEYEIVKSLLIAVLLGFIIGFQRTMAHLYSIKGSQKTFFAGSRTFALISLLGYISGQLYEFVPTIVIEIAAAVSLLIGISYFAKSFVFEKMGMTTQIAAIITYLLGFMIYLHLEEYAIFSGIMMVVLLESKPRLQKIEKNISPGDLSATVLLLAMTFLILPVLPNKMIGPYQLFNPYKTWLMAVIIAAISFVGYVAIKVLGNKRGVLLTGIFGGLISSTAVSVSLSKIFLTQRTHANNFVAGIAIACTFMYLRVLFEAFVINQKVAELLLIPYLAASFSGLIFVYFVYMNTKHIEVDIENPEINKNPLQLSEAIKFGILFGVIYGLIAITHNFGNIGVYIVSIVSGLTDVDAITLSLSQLEMDKKLSLLVSVDGIVIASITNSLVKLGIIYSIGGKDIGAKVFLFFLITLGLMGAGVWINTFIFT